MQVKLNALPALVVGMLAGLTMAAGADTAPTAEIYAADHGWPPGVDVPRLQQALLDSGQNWRELAKALDEAEGRYPDQADYEVAVNDLVWLIVNAPHLDRLELTAQMLHNNLARALAAADSQGYDPASDFFRRYVLNYRIDDEPVTDWREALGEGMGTAFMHDRPGVELPLLQLAARQIMDGFQFRERGYFGPQADPLSVRSSKAGTKSEAALLLAASLRASGYGTRYVSDNASGTSWVEIYVGDRRAYDQAAWLPVYPQAPERSGDPAAARELCGGQISVVTAGDAFGREQVTARYSSVATVQLGFTRGGEAVDGFEGFAITTWRDGRYVPLDDLEYPVSAMDYPLDSSIQAAAQALTFQLGAPGAYRLEAGVRYPGGIADVKLLPFSVEPGQTQVVTLALDAAPGLPLAAFVERDLGPLPADPAFQPQGRYLFAVYDDSEPSVRTAALLERYKTMSSVQYVVLDQTTTHERAREVLEWLGVKPEDPRPVVALVVDGKTRLFHHGYELNIADWVQRALEAKE